MFRRTTLAHIALAASTLAASACTLQKADDVSEYRDALPDPTHVTVAGPEPDGSGKKTLATDDGSVEVAEWYAFTRNVRDGVNVVTRDVLVGVWLVVRSAPSLVGADFAEWGPSGDALDPAAYRLRVQRSADGTYLYRLDGRPRSSTSDADYVSVLSGTGYGRLDPRHGDGEFSIDLDAAKRLDPIKHRDDSGTVSISHDLPARDTAGLPRLITAQVDPSGDAWIRIRSEANVDHTGSLRVDAHADSEASKATALEDISLVSRWRADGQGRADWAISGGDLPPTLPVVTASECWNGGFARVYYADSATFKPNFGDSGACVYSDSAL